MKRIIEYTDKSGYQCKETEGLLDVINAELSATVTFKKEKQNE